MEMKQLFSFESADFKALHAHEGRRKIYASRVAAVGENYAFNFIDLVIVPPNADIGLHTHSNDNQELYIIISGAGQMQVERERINVRAGDVIVNRIGGQHGLLNTGSEEMKIVVVEIPVAGVRHPNVKI